MNHEQIASLVNSQFDDLVWAGSPMMPILGVDRKILVQLSQYLRDTEGLYFDSLSCLTALDKDDRFEVAYNFYSIPYNHSLCVKVQTPKLEPIVPSLSHLWATANWHEREAFDLFGIHFQGHPDLRRILLPADWQGYPLRKDYQVQELYHGIKVEFL